MPVQGLLADADAYFVAKDRQPGAGSSALTRVSLVLLLGGLGCSLLPALSHINAPEIVPVLLFTAAFGLLAVSHGRALSSATTASDTLAQLRNATSAEAHFRSVISDASDAFMVLDRQGHILECKQREGLTTGYSSEELLGKRLVDVLAAPSQKENAIKDFDQLWDNPQCINGKYINRVFSSRMETELHFGITVWIDVDPNGNAARMNMLIRDEGSRVALSRAADKAIAAEREMQLRLEEVSNVKNQFVSSISHELRSPLTNTLGYLELLGDGDAGELTGEQAHMVEVASRNARRLRTLIEDILTLSKIESGAFSVQFRPVDVASTVLSVVERNTLFARDRSVNLSVLGHVNAGFLAGDRAELVRALDNIVGNAIKFTPPGGSVDIEVKRQNETIAFLIKDNGIGIPLEEQRSLFNRFYRATTAISQQHPGAGLGLTIAKAIFDHHGGSISVESDVSTGTKVTIEMPALPIPADALTNVAHDAGQEDSDSGPAKTNEPKGEVND